MEPDVLCYVLHAQRSGVVFGDSADHSADLLHRTVPGWIAAVVDELIEAHGDALPEGVRSSGVKTSA
jgi:hypothetical protein